MQALEILYSDNHVLAVNKPAGLLTQVTDLNADSVEVRAREWVKREYQKPGNVFLQAIHRIDKPVSGVVVLARTSKGLSRLVNAVREKTCEKIYHAVVEGPVSPNTGVLEDFLLHGDYRALIVGKETPDSKLARLSYTVLKHSKGLTYLEIRLETGRYHQIRVQLASRGHPIVGDIKYGSRIAYRPDAIALHHKQMSIPHPTKGDLLVFTAPLPTDWHSLA
jgi:23S rRNA pseudouridine1911/1915/1917 synthase